MGASRLPAAVEPIASGGNEALDDSSPGQPPVAVVVEPDHACREAPFGARPETPFHTAGFVRAEYGLGLRDRDPLQRLPANHRRHFACARKAGMEIAETVIPCRDRRARGAASLDRLRA